MDVKTLFGLTVIPAGILGGTLLACLSQRVRDLLLVMLVACSPLAERLDINYVSRDWYRGTSRGFEVTVLDVLAICLLLSCLLVPRPGERRLYWPASLGLMLLFFLYACANVAIVEPRLFGLFELERMVRGFIVVLAVAFYVRSERELKWFVLGVALLLMFQGLLAVKQRYLEGLHRVPGTLIESNSLSVLLVTTTPVMIAALTSNLPKWLKLACAGAVPLALVAEILTISRAGIAVMGMVLAGVTVCTARFRVTPRTLAIAAVVAVGFAGLLAKSWKTLQARFSESTMDQEYGNKQNQGRGYYIRMATTIAKAEFFGVGLNNWSYWVSNRHGPAEGYRFVPYKGTERAPSDIVPPDSNVEMAQAAPAHSLLALTLGELGIPGLVIFVLLWLRCFQMGMCFLWPRTPDPMRRLGVGILFGLGGMFLQCLTEWVFRHLPLYYTVHCMLGVLMALYYIRRQEKRQARKARREAEYAEAWTGEWREATS
jgi:hypothetical protein